MNADERGLKGIGLSAFIRVNRRLKMLSPGFCRACPTRYLA